MEGENGCNALLLPTRNKNKRKANTSELPKTKAPLLSKNQQRKLRRLQEEKEKKDKNYEVLETLKKYKLGEDAYALLHASSTRGQRESMREKLRRALHYERAGLKVPTGVPLLCERVVENGLEGAETEFEVASKATEELDILAAVKRSTEIQGGNGHCSVLTKISESIGEELCGDSKPMSKVQHTTKRPEIIMKTEIHIETPGSNSSCLGYGLKDAKHLEQHSFSMEKSSKECPHLPSRNERKSSEECEHSNGVSSKKRGVVGQREKKEKGKKLADFTDVDIVEDNVSKVEKSEVSEIEKGTNAKDNVAFKAEGVYANTVAVPVCRPEEVQRVREKLPIIMMEQEIMEAIAENPTTIICGETGCGKTTQVPQFLYEAGFSSNVSLERTGMIGVTQPRRVAVLATAKRVSHEMNLGLGQEVGFQVRHDRKVGKNTHIKFMTDGILLREVQSDILLRKYSVIVLDEAHERSLNTDILIGMLSRVLPLRQSIYEEQCREGKVSIGPLKLVIMSATLLVDEFVANRKLFACSPPVVEVPARQFPVTVHFSAKTELVDYVGKAYKKVCSIHKNLPPGGVLVFLTGQAEVHYLCKRLRKSFPARQEGLPKHKKQTKSGDHDDLKKIAEAADGSYPEDEFNDEAEMCKNWEFDESRSDSSSESDLEFLETEDMEVEKELKGDSEWNIESSCGLEALKEAFDAFAGSGKREDVEKPCVMEKQKAGPLYVLPLYALLPAASQLKIFGAVPEGSRIVVVATNVAETSITIPGIRYVVDCGRVKEKVFERASGITRYEVGWISKASAAQRAGRSGRTGPGHCYRLYSSAMFNDTFQDFSKPEIYRAPIDSLVLLLKSMNIVKVGHFPFLSEPNKTDLVEAECCLHALSALDSSTGLLTPLGKEISLYPISPRHSRMLLTAMRIGCSEDVRDTSILLAYAGATVAALSLDSPFVMDVACGEDSKENTVDGSLRNLSQKLAGKHLDIKLEGKDAALQTTKLQTSKRKFRSNSRYSHPLSDALGVVGALRAYEASRDPEEFCKENHLHARILYEMSKLRKQLIQIYLVFSRERGSCNTTFCNDELSVADIETLWNAGVMQEMNAKHENVLRQAICAGWADRVARKASVQEILKSKARGEQKKHKTIQYQTCTTEESVYLHPSSCLRKNAPEFVVFNELVRTSRPYMKVVTSIDAHWLVTHASTSCTFSKPLSDPSPGYDHRSDDVFCWVSPTFGPHLWQLPVHKFPLKSKKHRIAVFACALLQGKVLPALKALYPYLAADPLILVSPSGNVHRRSSDLLHALEAAAVDSRSKLKCRWDAQSDFLYQEILLWVQKNSYSQLERLWAELKLEAQRDGKSLFGKKKRKQHV